MPLDFSVDFIISLISSQLRRARCCYCLVCGGCVRLILWLAASPSLLLSTQQLRQVDKINAAEGSA